MLPSGCVVVGEDRDFLSSEPPGQLRLEVPGAAVVAGRGDAEQLQVQAILLAFTDSDEIRRNDLWQPEWNALHVAQAPGPAPVAIRSALDKFFPVIAQHLVEHFTALVHIVVNGLD